MCGLVAVQNDFRVVGGAHTYNKQGLWQLGPEKLGGALLSDRDRVYLHLENLSSLPSSSKVNNIMDLFLNRGIHLRASLIGEEMGPAQVMG